MVLLHNGPVATGCDIGELVDVTCPTLSMNVRRTRLSTEGDRAFPAAAARTWNSLPQHVTSTPSMCLFSEVALRPSSSRVPSNDFYYPKSIRPVFS